jgi:type IV pilus assembly protein PilY1
VIIHPSASGNPKGNPFPHAKRINPQTPFRYKKTALISSMAVMLGQAISPAHAAPTDIANVPMAVSNQVTPNVLVVYDNSQSMDAFMNGTLVSGNNPSTRSNIGRTVMRNAIGTYRNTFNWGLMTYEMTSAPRLLNTYAFYAGSDTGMVFTDDCVGYVPGLPPTIGVSPSNGNRRCVANPQPFPSGNFVTFDKSGDDADVQDVIYTDVLVPSMWALPNGLGTTYKIYGTRTTADVSSWAVSDFAGDPFGNGNNPINFTPTDAGYLTQNPPMTRQLFTPRGWGYDRAITGSGTLVQKVDADSPAQFSNLITSLGNETNGATPEIKNGAVYTPLLGSLKSAKDYFSTSLAGNTSPVQYSCQQNFVMMVTDGLPTGNTSGNLYSAADRANSCNWNTTANSCTTGSFGVAATEARNAANALRTTSVTSFTSTNKDGTGSVTGKYDVQTYVVALGETVANASALSVMNALAFSGGTGKAIAAGDATAFQNAITRISEDISAKVGSASAVAVSNARITSSDNASYTSKYDSGTWTGDLSANAIDVTTGIASATPLWTAGSAAVQLDLRSPSSRFIATSTDAVGGIGGVQFQPTTAATATKLSAAQQDLLGATDGAAVLSYLRGDRSGEPGTYRARARLLGDMINAEAVLVREPKATYTDAGYSAFKTANAGRTRMLYQAANDGMLHAFVAATGAESWAYVPNLIMGDLSNLSLATGFSHKYYVDSTPASADVDFANIDGTTSGGDWRTILVGGLGKGGRGYYALDVSNPTASSEVDVKNKVLWEFPNSIQNPVRRDAAIRNMGYSFGKPVMVKTTAKGWVALLTSGYNNGTDTGGDGEGHLYVVNPKTGDLIKDIPTPGCTSAPSTDPCGLAQISVSLTASNTVDYVYGGDLKGNIWRFDLTGGGAGSWSVSKFANLADATAAPQPITTAPQLKMNSGRRMVFVGTGQYLGNTDIPGSVGANASSSQTQTLYGLNDSLASLPTPLRNSLQQQTLTTSGTTRTITNNPVDYAIKKGWYIDLPITGERLFTQVATYSNNLVFTSNVPSSTKCEPGGSSWIQVVNSNTGGIADSAGAGAVSGISFGNVLTSSPVLFQLPNNSWRLIVQNSGTVSVAPTGSFSGGAGSSCAVGGNNTAGCGLPSPPNPTSTIKRNWRQLFLY